MSAIRTNDITITEANVPETTVNQRSYAPYIIGGGAFLIGSGIVVGITILIVYVAAAPSQTPPPVTAPPMLNYPSIHLTNCNREISTTTQATYPSISCNLGEFSSSANILFVKDNYSSDEIYVRLGTNLFTALNSIYSVISNTSYNHCPSTGDFVESICNTQSGNITCLKVLSHNTYLFQTIFSSNLTINMANIESIYYDNITNSLGISRFVNNYPYSCNGFANTCLTGMILTTFLEDDVCGI